MAHAILRLEIDPATGRKDLWIDYQGDPGALPMEHEEEHRAIVEKLISGGVLREGELGRVRVTRPSETPVAGEPSAAAPEPVAEKRRG
jgi:hypothetical protein